MNAEQFLKERTQLIYIINEMGGIDTDIIINTAEKIPELLKFLVDLAERPSQERIFLPDSVTDRVKRVLLSPNLSANKVTSEDEVVGEGVDTWYKLVEALKEKNPEAFDAQIKVEIFGNPEPTRVSAKEAAKITPPASQWQGI